MNPVEIIQFNEKQLERAKRNLVAAIDRRDDLAVKNLEHKIELFQATIDIVGYFIRETEDIRKKIEEVVAHDLERAGN